MDRESRWLSRAALIFVAMAAVMGWAASFVGLQDYGLHQMNGFTEVTAWFIPGAFDGAAFGTSLVTYRASINGRSALRGRLLMWAFTAVSSGINYIHQPNHTAQLVASILPMAAVAVFDVLLSQLKADYEARHGKRGFRFRPGLLLLRWLVDRTGTSVAFRQQVTDISVEEIVGLGPLEPESLRAERRRMQEVRGTVEVAEAVDAQPDHAAGIAGDRDESVEGDPREERAAVVVPEAAECSASSLDLAERFAERSANDGAAAERRIPAPESDAEQTLTMQAPPTDMTVDDSDTEPQTPVEMSDAAKRESARRDYLQSVKDGEPLDGPTLGARYGFTARWGRLQIAAAKSAQQQLPELVAAGSYVASDS